MHKIIEKSWFAVDGSLEEIDFKGASHFRFSEEVAEFVINTYSEKNDWVFDPFAGFGTTLRVAQRLQRKGIGFEIDSERAEFANKSLNEPSRVIHAPIEDIKPESLPKFDLLFTSPPYAGLRLEKGLNPWGESYFVDIETIFRNLKKVLKPHATIAVEVSNIRTKDGIRPLAWQLGELLAKIYTFKGEVIRCNTSSVEAGPGFNHSYVLLFKNAV